MHLLPPGVHLTAREEAVIALLIQGKQDKSIADVLHLSPRTVRYHLSNIFRKYHVSSRGEVMACILRSHGIDVQVVGSLGLRKGERI